MCSRLVSTTRPIWRMTAKASWPTFPSVGTDQIPLIDLAAVDELVDLDRQAVLNDPLADRRPRPARPSIRTLRLAEIHQHILRVSCSRCGRTLEIQKADAVRLAGCKTPSDVDLAAMKHPPTTFVHDLASRLRCRKCAKAGRRPRATLLQLAWQPRHPRTET